MIVDSILVILILISDQLSKMFVAGNPVVTDMTVIPNFFSITYVENTGAAWSAFSDKTQLLALVSAVASAILLWYILTKKPKGITRWAVDMILAGALGNMIDRLVLHYVRDFLNFYIFGYDFPVFNIADVALCVGVFLLFISTFIEEGGKKHES